MLVTAHTPIDAGYGPRLGPGRATARRPLVPDDGLKPSRQALARALAGAPSLCWWGPRAFAAYTAATRAPWPVGGGVYIFARVRAAGCRAIYVGETEHFAIRLTLLHERWRDALDFGATETHVWPMPGAMKAERRNLERDLREHFQPVLNPLPHRSFDWQRLAKADPLTPASHNCPASNYPFFR